MKKALLLPLFLLIAAIVLIAAVPPPMQYQPWTTNRAGSGVTINGAGTHFTNNQYDDLPWLAFGTNLYVEQFGTGPNKTNKINVVGAGGTSGTTPAEVAAQISTNTVTTPAQVAAQVTTNNTSVLPLSAPTGAGSFNGGGLSNLLTTALATNSLITWPSNNPSPFYLLVTSIGGTNQFLQLFTTNGIDGPVPPPAGIALTSIQTNNVKFNFSGFDVTVPSGDDRLLILFCLFHDPTERPTALSFNGDSMTLWGHTNGANSGDVSAFYLANPDVGTFTVTLSPNFPQSECEVIAVTLTGVDQGTPVGSFVGKYFEGTGTSVDVSASAGEWVVSACKTGDNSAKDFTFSQIPWFARMQNSVNFMMVGYLNDGAGTITSGFGSGYDFYAMFAGTIKPAP